MSPLNELIPLGMSKTETKYDKCAHRAAHARRCRLAENRGPVFLWQQK